MNKYLIISTVGNNSLHKEWIKGDKNFDLILIYYGDDNDIYEDYKKDCNLIINKKGQKFPLLYDFINNYKDLINSYKYIWIPDDDIYIDTNDINRLFEYADKYNLYICQASLLDYGKKISHGITKNNKKRKIRFTSFVEVMAPLFSYDTLLKLYDDFIFSESGWGLDISWVVRLNNPIYKIAIIDDIQMIHTSEVGVNYSRFKKHPEDDLLYFLKKYNITREKMNKIRTNIYK